MVLLIRWADVRRTYQATLAELTSLEELMRTMMADNGVHSDVINKLWQVYSECFSLHTSWAYNRHRTRDPEAAKTGRYHHSWDAGAREARSRH